MKYIFFLITFLSCCIGVHSQEIQGYVENGKPYIKYAVAGGEGVNFIAAKMAVLPAELLEANGLQANSVLREGQELRIPADKIVKPVCNGNNCLKVYYSVQQHEGLYRIGKNFGDIKVAQLKQLNKLASDAISPGQQLLVGYVIVNSVDAKQLTQSIGDKPKTADTTVVSNVKEVAESKPAPMTVDTAAKTQPTAAALPKPVDNKKFKPDTTALVYNGKGFFESQYTNGAGTATVRAATFKSETGWNDGKFYVLTNEITVGNIVRITNPVDSTVIYAKVLGSLPTVKGGDGIQMRINSAGAALLGLRNEQHFELLISY